MVKIVCKIINLSLPNLACFAPWRESIPAFEYFRLPENLRELRKFSMQCKVRKEKCGLTTKVTRGWSHPIKNFVTFVLSVVKSISAILRDPFRHRRFGLMQGLADDIHEGRFRLCQSFAQDLAELIRLRDAPAS